MSSKECLQCGKTFQVKWKYMLKLRKYCNNSCAMKYTKNYISGTRAKMEAPKKRININCLTCNKEVSIVPSRKNKAKFCSQVCQGNAQVERVSLLGKSHKGKPSNRVNYKHSEETKLKIKLAIKDTIKRGEESPYWILDRSKVKGRHERTYHDNDYKIWMKNVRIRDKWKCKINNQDCKGRLETHHILNWQDFPELRYEVNNGITLCHSHHPRGREEEKRMIPILRELLPVSK